MMPLANKPMSRSEYSRHSSIKRWKVIKCITLLTNGYSVEKISKQLNIYPKSVLKIETLFVKKRQEIQTKLGLKNRSYWTNEDEMIIQEYRAEDLTGEEKQILKKLI